MRHRLPTREELLASRWLRPLARHLHDDRLWHLERGSVARAAAIGVFFGFMIPVAQFLAAVAVAIALRAHIAVAAAATLVTNPFTFPPIYWAAYKVGSFVLGEPGGDARADQLEAETAERLASQGMLEGLWLSLQSAGAPLVTGLAIFAVCGALLAFAGVWLLWRPKAPPADPRAP